MAIDAKCTIFFTDGKYGWSESLWNSSQTTLDRVLEKGITLARKRLPLCGAGPQVPYIRVSDESQYRDSLIETLNLVTIKPDGTQATQGTQGGTQPTFIAPVLKPLTGIDASDRPYSAILVRNESGTLYRRLMYLRGCPDSIIVDPIGPTPTKAWYDGFIQWAAELIAGQWRFKVLSREPTNQPKPITGIFPQAAAEARIKSAGHGLAVLNEVRVFNCKGVGPLPKGIYSVSSIVDADNFTLVNYKPDIGTISYFGGGKYILRTSVYAPITNTLIRGQTSRKTGRPFDSPRGRRRVKK